MEEPAGLKPRLGASLIDFFILFMQYNVVVFLFSLASALLAMLGRWLRLGHPMSLIARGVYYAGWVWAIVVALVYFPFWWQRGGLTFGMRMMRLRVIPVGEAGADVGWGRAVVRGIVSAMGLALLGAGFWWMALDEKRQGWADKVAGTMVVHTSGPPGA